ncbi:efflux RND transporter periplasmic adaptor subunit [Zobellia galactanivorans]|uniref:efflux RND transporter periplasmic adaptor subunit n=1 Tax=Zobellia galactanivorans (strain DSM 12802 / CCUG 47099 / CIP 106680 / NCIMB 13871 / Dsij) TaxID=63186 RepID=UPI0026E1B494|nr:efflux RND transporter periplasmic adaptor subunit [Zobellia galactanivorans]MDO6808622.1 efflux RND transporter periplasmic adaptor subunit [Zobellia galactanivorans]
MQRTIYNITTLSLFMILLGCGSKASEDNSAADQNTQKIDHRLFVSKAQFERSEMALGHIEVKSFPITVQSSGTIDVPPENRASVSATMGGYIKTVPLLIGDKVRKGQVLLTLENPDFIRLQQDYMEVNEKLAFLKSEYERQKTMMAEHITSQKSFLQAESTYKTALATYNGLRKQLTLLNISPSQVESGNISSIVSIYAPISGSITKVNVSRGTYVSPASSIMEIINNDHIHLELSVFEKDIMKLKKGQEINFKVPESSTDVFEAEVHLIGTAIEDNRTIKVHGHLKNEEQAHFLPGMFVEAEIITDTTEVNAITETAVVAIENAHSLLKLNETTEDGYYFDQVSVKTSSTYNGEVALADMQGVTTKDTVLTKGAFHLLGGD